MSFFKTMFAAFFGVLLALLVLFLVSLVLLLGLVSSAQQSQLVQVRSGSVLQLDLGKPLQERVETDPFSGFLGGTSPVGLNQVLGAIRAAKTDERIQGIYLSSGWFGGGQASAESVRNALLDFRKSGKFIYAQSEYLTETAYYVATAADSIFLYPEGYLEWNGLASTPMYLRGALDKLGVQPMIFKVGTFKSYPEMFTEREMSPAAREQTTVLLNDLWQHMLRGISQRRNLPEATLQNLATNLGVSSAESAHAARLVDGLLTESQLRQLLKHRAEGNQAGPTWQVPSDSAAQPPSDRLNLISVADYAEASRSQVATGDRIAIVYAEGDVTMGSGGNTSIGSEQTSQAIRKARQDDRVKAIVLRINSPGGSSLASDIIWREVQAAKAVKPVIASFGDVAASGGYFIAAGADQIVAQPNTITGSIGIFAVLLNTQALFQDKLGITFDRVTTNPHADLANPNRPMTAVEQAFLQRNVNEGYSDFIRAVQLGRNFPDSAAVDQLAQGRVWSGVRARQLNLVDTLGGIDVALAIAASKAGLGDAYQIVAYPDYETFLESLQDGLNVRAWLATQFLTPEQRRLHQVTTQFNDPRHLYARLPFDLTIE